MITNTSRVVLQNVPRIQFYTGGPRCPEDICFPSVMRAALEYLGENLGCQHCKLPGKDWGFKCSYAYFTGVSGNAFLMSWKDGWYEDAFSMDYLPGDRWEPYRWTFKSIGYGYEIFGPEAGEETLRQAIVESIRDRNRPVIAFGVVGPPEPVLITGYDEDGQVLIGWSFFQKDPDWSAELEYEDGNPDHYFRQRDGYSQMHGLIVIGEKGLPPEPAEVFTESLQYALQTVHTLKIERDGRFSHTGLAGYKAWAEHLLHPDFETLDEEELRRRHRIHDLTVGMVAEARWYGSQWLIHSFERLHYNHAEALLKAAGCLAAEHALMWRAWDLCGGNGNPEGWKAFADPLIREQLAAVVEEARVKYAEAAGHIAGIG